MGSSGPAGAGMGMGMGMGFEPDTRERWQGSQ